MKKVDETAYLLRSKKTSARLRAALREIKTGEGKTQSVQDSSRTRSD